MFQRILGLLACFALLGLHISSCSVAAKACNSKLINKRDFVIASNKRDFVIAFDCFAIVQSMQRRVLYGTIGLQLQRSCKNRPQLLASFLLVAATLQTQQFLRLLLASFYAWLGLQSKQKPQKLRTSSLM